MKSIDSLYTEPEPNVPTPLRLLCDSNFVHIQIKTPVIELTENKDEADPLPTPIAFTEGTCEC